MQFKSIILTIAASVALVQAAAIPPSEPVYQTYDTCLNEISASIKSLGLDYLKQVGSTSATVQCSLCLSRAVVDCGPMYMASSTEKDTNGAKACYENSIKACKIGTTNAPVTAPPKTPAA